jgi:hypothetical protein
MPQGVEHGHLTEDQMLGYRENASDRPRSAAAELAAKRLDTNGR